MQPKTYKLSFLPLFEEDLNEIVDYITNELHNPDAALRLVDDIENAINDAWPWTSKKDKAKKDIQIEGISRMWNSRTENWVNLPNAINEVGCIHSIQGYDLNYCFVIIGPDLYFNEKTGKVCADASHYFDQNGKKTASQEELLEYIRHVYYVLMTRGIKGTYLYICDPALKKHFEQYIRTI